MAPIAEITHAPFRREVRRFSKSVLLYSEMLSAASIAGGGFKNKYLLQQNENDFPFVWQILGNDPQKMHEAAEMLSEKENTSGVDINMGCSAPDIVKKNMGSKLLLEENFETVKMILRLCRKAVKNKTLSIKIRCGYDRYDQHNFLNICSLAQDEGVDYIVIHPRTGKQAFKRKADWKIIETAKRNLNIPVIGNGDIDSIERASHILNNNISDGIMIARSAIEKPWIFAAIEGEKDFKVDLLQVAKNILLGIERDLPVEFHKSRMRRYMAYFCQNLKFGHKFFAKIRIAENADDMIDILNLYLLNNPEESTINYFASIT